MAEDRYDSGKGERIRAVYVHENALTLQGVHFILGCLNIQERRIPMFRGVEVQKYTIHLWTMTGSEMKGYLRDNAFYLRDSADVYADFYFSIPVEHKDGLLRLSGQKYDPIISQSPAPLARVIDTQLLEKRLSPTGSSTGSALSAYTSLAVDTLTRPSFAKTMAEERLFPNGSFTGSALDTCSFTKLVKAKVEEQLFLGGSFTGSALDTRSLPSFTSSALDTRSLPSFTSSAFDIHSAFASSGQDTRSSPALEAKGVDGTTLSEMAKYAGTVESLVTADDFEKRIQTRIRAPAHYVPVQDIKNMVILDSDLWIDICILKLPGTLGPSPDSWIILENRNRRMIRVPCSRSALTSVIHPMRDFREKVLPYLNDLPLPHTYFMCNDTHLAFYLYLLQYAPDASVTDLPAFVNVEPIRTKMLPGGKWWLDEAGKRWI